MIMRTASGLGEASGNTEARLFVHGTAWSQKEGPLGERKVTSRAVTKADTRAYTVARVNTTEPEGAL